MTRGIRFFLILAIGLLMLDGAMFVLASRSTPSADASGSSVISSGTAAIGGPFALISTDGKTVTDQSYRGKWLLIYFGYTFCPDACPTTLANMGIALQALGQAGDALQPLFVSVDPTRDTVAVLGDYLNSFDPRIVGLTGSQEQTDGIVKMYRIVVQSHAADADDANYLVDHSSYVYLMDPERRFVDVFEGTSPSDQMAAWLKKRLVEPVT